jgi:CubicO group peptidase (beta-lactamase class C family)
MPSRRTPFWALLILVPAAVLVTVSGLWMARGVGQEPLHPDAARIPAVVHAEPSPEWAVAVERAREAVRASIREKRLPGVSVAVGIDRAVVWAEGFGFADLRTREAVTPRDRFRTGTASIALTSAAVGLLLEQGRLKLDEEIQTYVPGFPRKQWPVTLRHLMGHTAGIVNDGGDEGPLFREHCEKPEEALSYFADEPLRFAPGTQFRHSSYGWILVSAAVEAAAGRPFLSVMQEQVFDPLGMRDTAADATPDFSSEDFPGFILLRELIFDPDTAPDEAARPAVGRDRVVDYFPRFAADPRYGLHVMRLLDYSCYAGASVFVSTPSDLVRFAMAMQAGKLLKPATVELLQTSQRLNSGEETGYGLGWYAKTVDLAGRPARIVGHNGDVLGGMAASLLAAPEHGIAVAVTSNISYADTFPLAVKIAAAFAEPR